MTGIAALLTVALAPLSAASALSPIDPMAEPFPPVAVDMSEVDCDRFASPKSVDRRRRGTARRPLRSVPRLLRTLKAGQTGCLLPGRYHHDNPATLSRPGVKLVGLGGRAKVDGAIWITERARRAQIRGLDLTATDSDFFIPLKVQANGARIAGNRIRGSRSTTCVLIGSTHRTRNVRIERNWIHRCGRRGKLDHLIYVQDAVGTVIRGNVLSDNPGGWGVHLYPNADRSVVERNLIDGNQGGVIFGGDGSRSSDGNVVRANAITYSDPRWNVEGSWDDAVGVGNVAYGNCLYTIGRDAPAGIARRVGFATGPSVSSDSSPYAVRRPRQYRFPDASPCGLLVEPLPSAFEQR